MYTKHLLFISSENISRGGVQKCIQEWVEHFDCRSNYDITWFCPGVVSNQEYFNYLQSLGIRMICAESKGKRKLISVNSIFKLNRLLKETHFDIVHINTGVLSTAFISVVLSKLHKITKIITHSHQAAQKSFLPKEVIRSILRKVVVKNSDVLLACSDAAGIHLFGKTAVLLEKYHKIINGIDIQKFKFDEKKREEIRQDNNVDCKKIIGFVGALENGKYPSFAIDLLNSISDSSYILWIFGAGFQEEYLHKKSKELCISNRVKFWGECENVADYYNAMDVLVLPSKSEGLSLVAVEAQFNGLPLIVSDTLSVEHNVGGKILFIPTNDIDKWRKEIMNESYTSRSLNCIDEIYDINNVSKRIETFYNE